MKNQTSTAIILSSLLMVGCAVPSNTSSSTYNSFSLSETLNKAQSKPIVANSSIAAYEYDRECKHPVESFRLIDSAAILGTLFAKAKMAETFGNKNVNTLLMIKNGAKQINWLPMEVEIMFSEKEQEQYKKITLQKNKAPKEYAKAQEILDTLVSNIGKEHDYKFQIFVTNGKGKEAIALPGGFVYVSKSALKDEKFVKFTLAHEISHSLKRHETMGLQSQIIDSIQSVDELSKVLQNPTKNLTTIGARALTNKTFFMKFAEDQELVADACAVALLKKAYPNDTNKIIEFYMSTLPTKNPDIKQKTVFDMAFASMQKHPVSAERRKNLIFFKNKQM
ncbi:MAG: M48 family metalloprotease [Sulfuricurvum sp.]|nr:M48 family metalloprotease [Sulfuricurvum sp.]